MSAIKARYIRLSNHKKAKIKAFLENTNKQLHSINNTKTPAQLLDNINCSGLTVGDYYNQNLK